MASNYSKFLYNDYEKACNKLDAVLNKLSTIEMLQKNFSRKKQKIGKFRSFDGAESYTIIRSCISTYKKNSINVFKALISAFENQTIIV